MSATSNLESEHGSSVGDADAAPGAEALAFRENLTVGENPVAVHVATAAELGQKETFYATYGEIYFETLAGPVSRPGSKLHRVTFHNCRAKKPDISCYLGSVKTLMNCLPLAQALAKRYRNSEESRCYDSSSSSTYPFPPEVENAAKCFEEVVPAEGTAFAAASAEQRLLFFRELPGYGDKVKVKLTLLVNVYNGNAHIWLKPFWLNPEAAPGTNPWCPTQRGFQFSIYDEAEEIMRFADRHLSLRYSNV